GGGSKAAGIWTKFSNNMEMSNNLIGHINSTGGGPEVVNGILLEDGTGIALLYNSIYLNAANPAVANFGAHGLGTIWYPKLLVLRNNLIINLSTPRGTGKATAIQWEMGTPTLQDSWDHNLYYSGNPGPNNLIYLDATNNDQTLLDYQTRVAPGEVESQTEDVLFVSTNPQSALDYLRPSGTIPTFVEGGAMHLTGLIDDHFFPGIRAPGLYLPKPFQVNQGGYAPDIGAIEGDYKPKGMIDIGIAEVVLPAIGGSCTNTTYSVKLTNYSTVPLDFSVEPVTINASMVYNPGPLLTNFPPVIINTGSLAGGASMTVVISTTVNFSIPGTYTFNATTVLLIDNNPSNDPLDPEFVYTVATGTAAISPSAICLGESVTLTHTGSSSPIQWEVSTNGGATWTNALGAGNNTATYITSPTVNSSYRGQVCGNYTNVVIVTISPKPDVSIVSITDPKCFAGNDGEVEFVVNNMSVGAYTWEWDNVASANNPITGLTAGTYELIVKFTGNGCTDTISGIVVNEPADIIVTPNITQPISCPGVNDGEITLTVTGGTPDPILGYGYSDGGLPTNNPVFNNLGPGPHVYTVVDANGCTGTSAPISIPEPTPMVVTLAPKDACEGLNNGEIITNVTGGTAPFNYTWAPVGTPGGSTVSNLAPGSYSVFVTDDNGCISPTVNASIVEVIMDVTLSSTNSSCEANNDGIITSVPIGGTTPLTYNWSSPAISGQNPSNVAEGTYTLTLVDAIGCQAVETITVERDTIGQGADFSFRVAGPVVTFTDQSTNAASWLWNFGNGNFSERQNPVENMEPGTYMVNLLIKSDNGCWAVDSAEVIVLEDFLIANVFTPNGDGKNDWFYIISPEFTEVSIVIFNRWGLKVWEITASEIRWDGKTAAGVPVPEGTYFYNFKGKNAEKTFDKSGFFQLLR
ncbi:MAG: gliding motility-associated C-terminal domain-containing protein, partial [Bacteroidetes bacterium]|nr:gliding motility-associated C-terminal domain-containing protein [Bacteroidota bacterium]